MKTLYFISFKSEILERCTDHVEVVESEVFYNLKDARDFADNAKIDYALDSSEVCRVKGEATVCHVKGGARINTRK